MNHAEFNLGFWHPFGPHGREGIEAIIARKRAEIVANDGWTLWSFQHRRPAVLEEWSGFLTAAALGSSAPPVVFCSLSPGAVDPAETGVPVAAAECQSYRLVGETPWRPRPAGVRVPHPFRGTKRQAAAFVVQRVLYPVEPFVLPTVQWFSQGQWQDARVPTRGEYLIRRGGTTPMRPVRAVLELRAPYLATVSADFAS